MRIHTLTALVSWVMIVFFNPFCQAQYPPPAGQTGSTAIFKDSSIFTGWATRCRVTRGYIKITDTSFTYLSDNKANYGAEGSALGKADEAPVSLGDGGYAVIAFDRPVTNEPGFDFAVFENGLTDTFLELAFVEVSSDSIHFFRFPAVSNTQVSTQVGTFGSLDATLINNLAGKYRVLFGTPFDLDELRGQPGLDIEHITHIRIVDAVGCIQPGFATSDSKGNIINDPWPTPFNTGGFDLDAVGVIHFSLSSQDEPAFLFPNPVQDKFTVNLIQGTYYDLVIYDGTGKKVFAISRAMNNTTLDISMLSAGIYLAVFTLENGTSLNKKIIKR